MTYRAEVDGLRAVAVLAVVLYHAGLPGLPGGFVGVDIFFVISGYLITRLLFEELQRSGRLSIFAFVERRIRRLAPALLLVIAATLTLGFLVLSPIGGEQQGLARSALAALALLANVYFWHFTGGYFDAPAESQPLLHLWSLAVEEQFYLVWPWLLWGAYALGKRLRPGRENAGSAATLGLFLPITAVSLAACVAWTPRADGAAFYLAPMRAWEFGLGALAFWCLAFRPALRPRAAGVTAATGLALIAVACGLLDRSMNFPGYLALGPAVGTALLIVGTAASPLGWVSRALRLRPLVWIGLMSYSWYLWHWPLLVLARVEALGDLSLAVRLLIVAIALGLAWLTYRFVEQPFRLRRFAWATSSRGTMGSAMAGMLVVGLLASALAIWSKWIWPSRLDRAELASAVNNLQKVRVPCGQPAPYAGSLASLAACGLQSGPEAGKGELVLWGDSHAAHLVPAARALAEANGLALRVRYMPECPPLIGFKPETVGVTRPKGCDRFNADVLAEVRGRQGNDRARLVILNARWLGYTRGGTDLAGLRQGLAESLAALGQLGVPVFLMTPGPEMSSSVPPCLVRRPAHACDLARSRAEHDRKDLVDVMKSAATARPGVVLVDPFEGLCDDDNCAAMRGGAVLYSDAHHWTVQGSLAVLPALRAALGNRVEP